MTDDTPAAYANPDVPQYVPEPLRMTVGAKVRKRGTGYFGICGIVEAIDYDKLTATLIMYPGCSYTRMNDVPLTDLELVENAGKEYCIGHTMVNNQLCELWHRAVPHAYGMMNRDDCQAFWWVKYVRQGKSFEDACGVLAGKFVESALQFARDHDAVAFDERNADLRDEQRLLRQRQEFPSLYEHHSDDKVEWIEFYNDLRSVWSVKVTGWQRPDYKHEEGLRSGHHVELFCNGMAVGECYGSTVEYALSQAQRMIEKWQSHPIFTDIFTPERIVGRKVWWKGQPFVVGDHLMLSQNALMLVYDGPDADLRRDPHSGRLPDVKEDIFAPSINWYRNEGEVYRG